MNLGLLSSNICPNDVVCGLYFYFVLFSLILQECKKYESRKSSAGNLCTFCFIAYCCVCFSCFVFSLLMYSDQCQFIPVGPKRSIEFFINSLLLIDRSVSGQHCCNFQMYHITTVFCMTSYSGLINKEYLPVVCLTLVGQNKT